MNTKGEKQAKVLTKSERKKMHHLPRRRGFLSRDQR